MDTIVDRGDLPSKIEIVEDGMLIRPRKTKTSFGDPRKVFFDPINLCGWIKQGNIRLGNDIFVLRVTKRLVVFTLYEPVGDRRVFRLAKDEFLDLLEKHNSPL